ncbi:MAG TPA: cytochrome b [Gammaproteobacteria bacterium]|jgi:cytochrome b561
MLFRNTPERFGLLTKLLHWAIALLIIFLIWLGWYMVDLTYYDKWYNASLHWHRALGLLVLALAVCKIGWQLYSPAPHAAAALKPWERRAARGMHLLLLLMMVLIPVTGYVISTSAGKSIPLLPGLEIPALFSVTEPLRDLAEEVHEWLAYATLFLVAGHAGAALKHQFVNRDGTLARMLWK